MVVESTTDKSAVRSLIEARPFAVPARQRDGRLLAELNGAFAHHYAHCELFRRICDAGGWSPDRPAGQLDALPFLPAQYFKEAGEQLVSVTSENLYRTLSSSATSGRASTVVLDRSTARRQARAVARVLADFIGAERRPMLIGDVAPGTSQSNEISARAAAMLGFMSFGSSFRHLLRSGDGVHIEADTATLELAHGEIAAGAPVTLVGFTFLLYTALLEPLERAGRRFVLPRGSTILHIGGWKKLEDRKVDRQLLARAADAVFGVPAERVVDCYGFTEQMGTVHAECAHGRKHVPAFADLVVRDPLTLRPVPDGAVGIGQFLSLVPESYPGFSVLTDDLVRVLGRDDCPCGRLGTTFEVLGRDRTAEIRGCGDVLAEKVVLGGAPQAAPAAPNIAVFRVPRAAIHFADGVGGTPRGADWLRVEAGLRAAQARLATLSADDIVGTLAAASVEWARDDLPFVPYRAQGLSFVVNLLQGGGLQRMVDTSLRGGRGVLDGFRPDPAGSRRLRALPRGIVAHWLAGNVPTLGLLSLMLSLVAKNANVLKVPEGVAPILPALLASMARTQWRAPTGRIVDGRILSDAVQVVWFPHDAPDGAILSTLADARVVWGGAEAVRAISTLPRRYDCEDIVFGPKLSIAAIGREALANDSLARRAARGVAIDCSVFDQAACASAHTVFVERGGAVSPRGFAALLADHMERAAGRIARGPISGQTAGDIKSERMRHFQDGEVFAPQGLEWTVLFRDRDERPAPVYGRTVFVRVIDDLHQVARFIDRATQVVGLALPSARRLSVAESMAAAGVDRITEPGAMADFAAPWDGLFPLERLIRWVSLER